MGVFLYKAVNSRGEFAEGQLEAPDTRAAAFSLQNMGLIPVSIETPTPSRSRGFDLSRFRIRMVTRRDILFFTEELTTLVRAGLPLDRSLTITAELASSPGMESIIRAVLKDIKGGKSLAEALESHPKYFSRLYVNMVRAGETGGMLDAILERLVEFERSSDELRSHLISSLIYPVLLSLVGLGSIGILFYFVIPRFATIFDDVGAPIPPFTLALMTVSDIARSYWWLALGVPAALAFLGRTWVGSPAGRRQWDGIKLRVPLLGPTLVKIEMARFARTLGTLLASAVPLISGVRIVQEVVGNRVLSEAISKIADGAKRGEGVSRPMRETGVFPGLAVHLVGVGEETGQLDSMLLQLADVYDKDVKTSVKALTAVFEPMIILVMGVLIGGVVLSMLLAVFSINEVAF